MGIEKSELKKLTIHDIGCRVDDMLEACNKEREQLIGGKSAAEQVAKLIDSLNSHADKDLESGAIPDLETLSLVKKYIGRAFFAAKGLADNLANREVMSAGKQDLASKVIDMLSNMQDQESQKIKSLLEAEEDDSRRPTGRRPDSSVAARRKAEESKADKKKPSPKKTKKTKKINKDGKDS